EKMRFEVPQVPAILTYLYGDISSRETEAAVCWEYCRENPEIVRVANVYREAVNSGSEDPMLQTIIDARSPQFMGSPWAAIWSSLSFPPVPLSDLKTQQKEGILLVLTTSGETRALKVPDVRLLHAMKVFNHWNDCAQRARKAGERKTTPARYATGTEEHIVITINYREGLDHTEKAFGKWLREPDQAKNFASYQERR